MAISDSQKVDYLWKKLGYGKAKTDTNALKKAPNEAIDSPLLMRGDIIWAQADLIPSTIPASTTTHVRVYSGTSAIETTNDNTASANRTWKTGQTDWIPTQFGSTYLVKVYTAASGTANAPSSGTQLFPTGSGNDDEWFFDYEAGVLHFIGANVPSSVSGKVIFIEGARYIGSKGIASANSFTTVGAKTVQANTISMANTTSSVSVEMSGANSTVQSANVIINKTATINELRLGNHVNNGVLIGRTFNKRIDFVSPGSTGTIFQVAANGTPTFSTVDGGSFDGS
jgi:hypothetical protein